MTMTISASELSSGSSTQKRTSRYALVLVLLALAAWIGIGLRADSASASAPPILWQKCEAGSAAGDCGWPQGVVADPDTGSVYVVDQGNHRVNEFSPWGLFLKSWGWGVADGAAHLETCGPAATPPTATCQAGIKGGGAGQFGDSRGIAIDSAGNLYVHEVTDCDAGIECEDKSLHPNRVQKFASDGSFILMFGKEVNLTRVAEREAQEAASEPVTVTPQQENICTAASGDICGPGKPGSGPGEFGSGPLEPVEPNGNFLIATTPSGKIEVGGQEHIQIFDQDGQYESSISLPGKLVRSVAVDGFGNGYVIFKSKVTVFSSEDDVLKLSGSGTEICKASVKDPRSIAVDDQGRLYVAAGDLGDTIHRFSPTCLEEPAFSFVVPGVLTVGEFVRAPGLAIGSACGMEGSLYFGKASLASPFLRAYYPGPDPDLCPPPPVPPVIDDQYAASVGTTEATVRAAINPRFWGDTTYYVEYGTEDCASAPGACDRTALFPGAHLTGDADQAVKTSGVFLAGLQPDTVYHFRFVAVSGGGGPVRGAGAGEEDATFRTYPAPEAPAASCPNAALRNGSSAQLPDCRAYEMVSPVDKQGGDIVTIGNATGFTTAVDLAAGSGGRFTYSSYRAFADPQAAPLTSQFLATRGSDGWVSEEVNPPQEGEGYLSLGLLENFYRGFDEELCNGWLIQPSEPLLAPGAIPGYTNLYRRQNCGGVGYQALTTQLPSAVLPAADFRPALSGFSADGTHAIFTARGGLTADAAPCTTTANSFALCPRQLYEAAGGDLRLVCILPNGQASKEPCRAGTSAGQSIDDGREGLLQHAISEDGSRIFWTTHESVGKLYVRIAGSETKLLSAATSRFWAAAADGSRAIFSVYASNAETGTPGDLYEAEVATNTKLRIAREVTGVVGVSEDARRVYFVSREDLTGEEENSAGQSAQAGEPNLYLHEAGAGAGDAGAVTFVSRLSPEDVEAHPSNSVWPVGAPPFLRTARVSPDGMQAAFASVAPLTGADNISDASGRPVSEVFLYDAAAKKLRCVSCSPANARPEGHDYEFGKAGTGLWVGGTIAVAPNEIDSSRPLSDDGRRLFFESYEPLLPADTNGQKDVYEWEAGESAPACREAGAQLFLRREGGCLSLISSGQSPAPSTFLDAGRSGRDAFFTTGSSLVPQDPGLVDVYDAREGGGFQLPPQPPAACEGEACQGAYSPPQEQTPASEGFQGPGNVDEKKHKRKHHKNRKHRKKHKRHASHGGAGRDRGGNR